MLGRRAKHQKSPGWKPPPVELSVTVTPVVAPAPVSVTGVPSEAVIDPCHTLRYSWLAFT